MNTRSLDSLNDSLASPCTTTSSPSTTADACSGSKGVRGETFHWEELTLVIRGYLRPAGSNETLLHERLAEELRWRYLEQGALDLAELEGSATVALFDDHTGEVQAARSVTSPFPLFYTAETGRLLLSSRLAELAGRARQFLVPDRLAAKTWLEEGELPDRNTLFEGLFRLLPGERITFEQRGLCRYAQAASLVSGQHRPTNQPPFHSAQLPLTRLDAVMRDCLGLLGRPATVLAGRWPSVWLQLLRNRCLRDEELMPASVSLAIDEPDAWAETDWVMGLAQRLGTGHLLLPLERLAPALLETLAATAEPPISDLDLFHSTFAAQLKLSGLRSVLLDGGVDPLGHELSRDQALIRRAEQALACLDRAGVEALCPFLDSRLPADGNLGRAMKPFLPALPAPPRRSSRLLTWFRPGQPLAGFAEQTRTHDLISLRELEKARLRPTERFARLVCYDLWHRLFLES